jgi:Zinc carboxypeptidase
MTSQRERELLALLDRLPEYERFPAVDELAAELERVAAACPDVVSIDRVGTSRLGEPIAGARIGAGSRHALVFAFPHPNEPVGGLTSIALAELLGRDASLRERLDLTWHVVPCIDPDGARLNEGWFAGPFERTHYARHFYRPAPAEQVDWTFPFAYKRAYFDAAPPETIALMRLIDEHRPALLAPLHNSETGGVYYYLSREAPDLYPLLHAVPTHLGLKLDLGEPESPHTPRYAPAIFGALSAEDAYDASVEAGHEPESSSGSTSTAYAGRYGGFSIIPEVPFWTGPSADDTRETDTLYADVLRRQSAQLGELGSTLERAHEQAEPALKLDTPFLRAGRAFTAAMGRVAEDAARRAEEAASARPATAAEVRSCAELVHVFRTRFAGILVRALEAEVTAGVAAPAVRAAHAWLSEAFEAWCEEAKEITPPTMLPIRSLVATQFGAVLASALWLRDQPV